MKVIIAGGTKITEQQFLEAIKKFPYGHYITEVVSGNAKGVDSFGEAWAKHNSIPINYFIADWRNFDLPFCVIKTNKFGYQYNAAAGIYRNQLMADYADRLILIYDGKSTGSSDMLKRAKKNNLPMWIYNTTTNTVEINTW